MGCFQRCLTKDRPTLHRVHQPVSWDPSWIKRQKAEPPALVSASWLWCKVATARDTLVTCHQACPTTMERARTRPTLSASCCFCREFCHCPAYQKQVCRPWGQVPGSHCFQSLHSGWGKQQSEKQKISKRTRSRKGKKSDMKMFTCDWATWLKRNYEDMITWYEVIWYTMMMYRARIW